MTAIRRFMSIWILALAGSLLLPQISLAAVSGMTYGHGPTTTTTPAIIAEHASVAGTDRASSVGVQDITSGQTRTLFFFSRSSIAPKNTVDKAARRAYLNQKYGRTGNLDYDINRRTAISEIHRNASEAARLSQGTPGTYGRFGTQAHGHFERLNTRLNNRIRGTGFSVSVEQFRGASPAPGVPGPIVGRRAAGSKGLDVVLEYNRGSQLGFDLKTGRGWSATQLQEYIDRFVIPIEELHP